jgi:hypothetical protein
MVATTGVLMALPMVEYSVGMTECGRARSKAGKTVAMTVEK